LIQGMMDHKMDATYSVRVVKDVVSFDELRPEWDRLVDRERSHAPFLCHDWFRIWVEHCLGDNGLLVLVVQEEGEPVLIAPFVVGRERYKGTLKARKIQLMGNAHSPVRTLLFADQDSERRSDWLHRLLLFLKQDYREWDVMELEDIPEEWSTFELLEKGVNEEFKSRSYGCFSNLVLENINYSSDGYWKRLPSKVRNELKRRQKRLSEMGEVETEIGTSETEFTRHMEYYERVREKSWKNPERNREFLYEIRRMAARKGWLRCGFLLLDGEPIAAQIRIVADGTAYFMEALHDTGYNKYGPGHLLRAELIRQFIDVDGVNGLDQVRGDESYKKEWMSDGVVRLRKGLTVFNRNLRGTILAFLITDVLERVEKSERLRAARRRLAGRLGRS